MASLNRVPKTVTVTADRKLLLDGLPFEWAIVADDGIGITVGDHGPFPTLTLTLLLDHSCTITVEPELQHR